MEPMRNKRRSKRIIMASVVFIVLLGGLGTLAFTVANDFICSKNERRVMSEFPHYDGADLDWEADLLITEGCTTSYTADADPYDIRAYYQERFQQNGWTVTLGPSNSFPIHLEAKRDDVRYFLMFDNGDPYPRERAEGVLKRGTPIVMEFDGFELEPGQTRVSISGGHGD
jgi:hypothetical protein